MATGWLKLLDSGQIDFEKLADAVAQRHVQNTDTHLARGTTDEVSAAQAKLAYDKIDKHQYLDYGGVNQVSSADVKDAVVKKHTQNTDSFLAGGTANAISAQTIKADLPQQQSGTGTANFTMTIPAGRRISFIIVKNTGENDVAINIGTTSGGNDVWEGTVGGSATTDCGVMYAVGYNPLGTVNAIQQRFFSYTSDQTLYISSASWNSASVTVYIVTQRVV